MWMNITKIRTEPARANELIALIRNDQVAGAAMATHKIQASFVLQPPEDPAEIVSITVWQDKESGIAFFSDAAYAKLGQQMRPYLVKPPERAGYEIKTMGQLYAGQVLRYP